MFTKSTDLTYSISMMIERISEIRKIVRKNNGDEQNKICFLSVILNLCLENHNNNNKKD